MAIVAMGGGRPWVGSEALPFYLGHDYFTVTDAVFEFDDTVRRRIIQPHSDIIIFDINRPFSESIALVKESKYSHYPLGDGSLADVLGVMHIRLEIGLNWKLRLPKFWKSGVHGLLASAWS